MLSNIQVKYINIKLTSFHISINLFYIYSSVYFWSVVLNLFKYIVKANVLRKQDDLKTWKIKQQLMVGFFHSEEAQIKSIFLPQAKRFIQNIKILSFSKLFSKVSLSAKFFLSHVGRDLR